MPSVWTRPFWSNIIFRIQGTKTSLKGSHDVISLWRVTSIDKIPEVTKTKVSKTKRYSLSKLRLVHALLKQLIQTLPHMSRSRSGKICITRLNVCVMKEGGAIILALVLFWRRCERETTLFGIQKRTRLEISGYGVFTTLFQNKTQILECAAHFTENGLIKDCFYKVEQFQLYKFLTHSL